MAENPPVVVTGLKEDRFKSTEGHYALWRIKNFINRGQLRSPNFTIRNMRFSFVWERSRYADTSKECFEIFLKCEHLTTRRMLKGITVTTYLKDQYDKRFSLQTLSRAPPENVMYFRIWHAEMKAVLAELCDLKEEGHFVEVVTRIELKMGPRLDIRDQLLIKRYKDPWIFLNVLSEDSLTLLKSGIMTDVTLKCGEQTVKAHKMILSMRSRKFADLIVNNEDTFNINDMNFSTLEHVLHYIYSGKLPEITKEEVLVLNKAACRYGIEGLQKCCASLLILNLEPKVLVDQLSLGDDFSDWFKDRGFAYLQEIGHLPNRNWRLLIRQSRKAAEENEERNVDEAP